MGVVAGAAGTGAAAGAAVAVATTGAARAEEADSRIRKYKHTPILPPSTSPIFIIY